MIVSVTSRVLDVYWDQTLVGQLTQTDTGTLRFAYNANYLHSKGRAISLSLPLQETPFDGGEVKSFFSGLLPDETVRVRLAKYLGVSDRNPFALLQAVGGECAGALALYQGGETPHVQTERDIEILDDKHLVEILDLIKRRPMLAGDDGLRLSLAGAQDKLAVGFDDDKIVLMKGGQPTTHILKPIISHVTDSAHNELFCMRLARMVGIEAPKADIHFAGDIPCYLVERYDRVRDESGVVKRIHQEDFCQAMGIPPELKYEREGGPSVPKCQQLLLAHSARPAVDQVKFLDMIIFNYLIGNADAHGKNFSLLLYRGEKPVLAPAYDLLSTAVYPDLSKKMAMKIGSKYLPSELMLRHWQSLVPDTKASQSSLHKQLKAMTEKTRDLGLSLARTLTAEGLKSTIYHDINTVIEARSKRIEQLLSDG